MSAFRNAITPVLTVRRAAEAVTFYERAFAAEEIYRNSYPDGRIVAQSTSPQWHLSEAEPAGRRP